MEGDWFPLVILGALLLFGAALLFILKRSQREDAALAAPPAPGPGEGPPTMEQVDRYIRSGDKEAAVREYRRLTGAFDAEARALVDRRLPPEPPPPPAAVPAAPAAPPTLDEVRQLLLEGKPIDAMARYRQLTGASEADVKAAIDQLIAELPNRP